MKNLSYANHPSRSPMSRRILVSVVLAILLLMGIAGVSSLSLAQSGDANGEIVATPPPPPPPLNPSIQTPEPGQAASDRSTAGLDPNIKVVRFRPKERIIFDKTSAVSKRTDKPAGSRQEASPEEMAGPQEAYVAPDYRAALSTQGWNLLLYDGFEGIFPGDWLRYDTYYDDGLEYLWGDTNYGYQEGSWSVWPAEDGADGIHPSNGYPNYVDSWLISGPFDLSDMSDVFVGFGMWYSTEPEYDWIKFCVSVEWPYFNCDYWSGYSGGWVDQDYWLTSYAGYSEVRFAWLFTSDYIIGGDYGYLGPFVDEVYIWGYDVDTTPTPTPTPDPQGQLIQNGSFETGDLTHWSTDSTVTRSYDASPNMPAPSSRPEAEYEPAGSEASTPLGISSLAAVGVLTNTYVEGEWSAYLWQPAAGDDFLYQTLNIPSGVDDIVINYWFAVTTYETNPRTDWFCVSLANPANHDDIWVDLGCMDATNTTGYWQEALYTLNSTEMAAVAGKQVDFVFELYNRGASGTGTAGWVDFARLYATGSGGGEAIDPNEPNDDWSEATTITCGQTLTGAIGDALGGYDVDWFEVNNVPTGQMDIDIDARTKIPRSSLDSVVGLWESGPSLLTWNDDDGLSYDSYITYTNQSANATYYISVESYDGAGSPDYFYDLTVQCGDEGDGPGTGGTSTTEPASGAWTIMLYLNAEDDNFETILVDYIQDIEDFIGSKQGFMTATVLYDGPSNSANAEFGSGTTRLLLQPTGSSYTSGVNRWNMGELNMGHPDTLANFASWAMDQYPADHYYLAIDDHGDGAYGISFDAASYNDQLTPPDLYSALKTATNYGNRKIDIFDYEACLMGLAENAYDLRQWVDYVVFFEQISWGLDTYPIYFNDLARGDSPFTVGQRIIDRYYNEAYTAGYPHTISLIDTGAMESVRDAVTDFANVVKSTDTQAQKDVVKGARNSAQAFASDYDATNPDKAEYIDLWDLADKAGNLAPSQAAAVKSAVDAAVVAEKHASGGVNGYIWNHNGAHGLSIYYPPSKSSSAFSPYIAGGYRMSQDGDWDEFLSWVFEGSGDDDRKGMSASRAEIKLTGDGDPFVFKYIYLPVILK